MRLKDVFIEVLKEYGIEFIGTNVVKVIKSKDPIKTMALLVANGKVNICYPKDGAVFDLNGNKSNSKAQAFVGKCDDIIIERERIVNRYRFPYVVIDCRFYDLHSEKEKKKLLLQIRQTLNVVREFMWDERLIVTLDCGCGVYYPSVEDFLAEKNFEKVILLDPEGEEEFKGEFADCYIIGGIVDKAGDKKGWTSKICKILREKGFNVKSQRILLRGDVIGVPDRLNHIAEIVLRVVLDGEDVENAIRSVQPYTVAKWRLRKVLHEYTVRVRVGDKTFRVLPKSVFKEFNWLNLRISDFYEVCSEMKYFVVSDEVMETIKRSKWDEKRRCYVLL